MIRKCVNCNCDFIIDDTNKNYSIQKRRFCGSKCKNAWNRRPENGEKIVKQCIICGKEMRVYKSQSAGKVCSKECKNINQSQRLSSDKKSLKCEHCGKNFDVNISCNRKYCSPQCSSLSKRTSLEKQCEICNKTFQIKKSAYERKRFCSRNCQMIAQSNGKIHIHVNGRSGYRIDIKGNHYFKSAFEADYARYLQYSNIAYEYEPKTFEILVDNQIRHYTPDFWNNELNCYIELKGVRKSESNNFSLLINSNSDVRQRVIDEQHVNIKVIYMNDFYSFLKEKNLYSVIPNIENRNYGATKYLVKQHNYKR